MTGETDLVKMLKTLKPVHTPGDYVFCVIQDLTKINISDAVMMFRESEGYTIILKKELADSLNLTYSYIAGWITLTVHSSLSAVGLTEAFSKALSAGGISCNVAAGYYHDHIFVAKPDVTKVMETLLKLSE
jgi:hypothetical protein